MPKIEMADAETMALMREQMGAGLEDTRGLSVQFSMEAIHDPNASEAAGRPIFNDLECITIHIAGDKDNVIRRPIRETDKVRFPKQYQSFKMNEQQPTSGTPLDSIPFLSPGQKAEFKMFGVKTAEQIIEMSDSNAQKFMGYQQIRSRVKTFLDAAAGAAPALKLQAELEKRDGEIAALKRQMEELAKRQVEKKG